MYAPVEIWQSIFLGLTLLLIGYVLIFFIKSGDTPYAQKLFIGAFFARAISVYLVYFYLLAIGGDGFAFLDDIKYDKAGRAIAAALTKGKDGYALYSHEQNVGYFYFSGWLYSVLGPDTLSARMVNAFFGAFTAAFVFVIASKLYGPKPARVAGLLSAFLPNLVYWSALQFKDAALIFFTMFFIYLVVTRLRERFEIISFLGLVASTCALWVLRKDFCLPLIGIVTIWTLMRYTGLENWIEVLRKKRMSLISTPIAAIFIFSVLGGLAITQAGKTFIDRYERLSQLEISGSPKEKGIAKPSSVPMGFSRHLRIKSPVEIIKVPFAVGFTVLLPLPAWSSLTNQNMAGFALYSVANIFFIFLVPFVALGFYLSSKILLADALLVRWLPFTMLIGISIIFIGVLRYKEQLMPFFVLWAAIAICERKEYRKSLIGIYVVGLFAVTVAVILATIFR